MDANGREFVSACFACFAVKSPLKKPPGEGTGPTRHADLRGNLVGRVPHAANQTPFRFKSRNLTRTADYTDGRDLSAARERTERKDKTAND